MVRCRFRKLRSVNFHRQFNILGDDISDTTFTPTHFNYLLSGIKYYWKVRENNGGLTSLANEFTTYDSKLTLTTNQVNETSINLAWSLSTYAVNVMYDIYYSKDNFITTTPLLDLRITNTTISCLDPGTTYKLFVRAKSGTGNYIIAYTSIFTFTTAGVPTLNLIYPVSGVTIYGNPPNLYWKTSTAFTGRYLVRYSPNSSVDINGMLNNGAVDLVLTSNCFARIPGSLTPGATYYWQVRCSNGAYDGLWSPLQSFVVYNNTTTVTAPIPYPSWPVGNNKNYINPPTFYWYTGTITSGIYFEVVWSNDNFSTTLGSSDWFASNLYFTLPASLPVGNYSWRVRSKVGVGGSPGAWSSIANFIIPESTNLVSLPYPVSPIASTVQTLTPTLTWVAYTPPALNYKARISQSSSTDLNGMLDHASAVSSGWIGTNSIEVGAIPFALSAGSTYYWQVKSQLADAPNKESDWSHVVSFQTAANLSVIVPLVISPIKNQPINNFRRTRGTKFHFCCRLPVLPPGIYIPKDRHRYCTTIHQNHIDQ